MFFSQYLSKPVSLFLYLLYLSSQVTDLFFKNCLYSRFFFLHACFKELVIHGLSGIFLTSFCLVTVTGQVVLYMFFDFAINVSYIYIFTSQNFIPVSFFKLVHHDIYVMIINYSLCIIYDICAFIMFIFKYEENRQVIT